MWEGIAIYEEIAKDRILETENLTDALDGDSANWLIDWAIGQIPVLLRDVTDEAAADEIIHGLMQTMRTLNVLGADAAELPAEDLVESVREFSTRFSGVNRTVSALNEDRIHQVSVDIAGKPPLESLPYLVKLITPPTDTALSPESPSPAKAVPAVEPTPPAPVNPLGALMNAVSGMATEMQSAKANKPASEPTNVLTADLADSGSDSGKQGLTSDQSSTEPGTFTKE